MPKAKTFDPNLALDRAVELFWQLGYEGASMAKLLEFMGISRQSLYDTFGDKHSLFLAAVDRYRERVQTRLTALLDGEASPLAGIRAVFTWVDEAVLGDPLRRSCLMANVALERAQHDREVRARVAAHLRDVEDLFCAALERAQAGGELRGDADPRALARFLTSSIHGLGIMARGGAPEPVLRDSVTATLSLLAA